ncbi:MAG TPA: DUF2185 domain-containing protein [Gemmatales bacterium]|nr:DUF2185 domain-containing protein [Gemmatales bacterium]
MNEPQKNYKLQADQIKPLAEGYGACFATDFITVQGQKIGYMYREEPDEEDDSGWRFMAGHETQDYMDDVQNIDLYDVNTIANYDPDIIPFLEAPYETAFERDETTGEFVEVDFDAFEDDE